MFLQIPYLFIRFYIEAKLHTDLKTELTKLFSCLVADKHVKRLINLMVMVQSIPFSVPPDIMATLCRHLYTLNPDYANIHPGLFSSYLPNVGPRMTEEDLQVRIDHIFKKDHIYFSLGEGMKVW